MNILESIRRCFHENRMLYSSHARKEMNAEELGKVKEAEVFDSIDNAEILEDYPADKPYQSVLVLGFTTNKKPLHIVCAYDSKDDLAIVITVYRPNPNKWINFRTRRR